ncbi:hypothetical protein KCU81_g8599, partial [Aureobasidium melanogenum]|uniref:Uncharacterized protein n=1 Tax=Aureobasidium melanogenum (strain CBS 110374) TaxID=1043003 RepID=A0A074VUJ0_AURM1
MSIGFPPAWEVITRCLVNAIRDTFSDDVVLRESCQSALQDFLAVRRSHQGQDQGSTSGRVSRRTTSEWMSWDKVIDDIWEDFLAELPSIPGRPRSRFVKPSGPSGAVMLIVWHVPTTNTTKYKEFGVVADGSNPSLRNMAVKFGMEPKLDPMSQKLMCMEHVPIRYFHDPKRGNKLPYDDLSQSDMDILLRYKLKFWNASKASVVLLLRRENTLWYRKTFPDSTAVKLSEEVVYGKPLEFFMEWAPDGTLKRLVFSSLHMKAFFWPTGKRLSNLYDAIWNMAAGIANYPVVNLKLFVRLSKATDMDFDDNSATFEALQSGTKGLGFDEKPWEIAVRLRREEIERDVHLPLNALPDVLQKWLQSTGGLDLLAPDSPVRQCLRRFGRRAYEKQVAEAKAKGEDYQPRGLLLGHMLNVLSHHACLVTARANSMLKVKERDALKTPEQLAFYEKQRARARSRDRRRDAGEPPRRPGAPAKFATAEERAENKKENLKKRDRLNKERRKAGLVNVAPKGFPFRTADEPITEAELAYHARQALIAKGRPDTDFGMGFTSETHESNIGQVRWKKLAPGRIPEQPAPPPLSAFDREKRQRRSEQDRKYRARRAAGQAIPLHRQGPSGAPGTGENGLQASDSNRTNGDLPDRAVSQGSSLRLSGELKTAPAGPMVLIEKARKMLAEGTLVLSSEQLTSEQLLELRKAQDEKTKQSKKESMQKPQAKIKKAERQRQYRARKSAGLVGKSVAGNGRKFSMGTASVDDGGQADDVEMIDLTKDD